MKPLIFLFILISYCSATSAQVYKVFIDSKGRFVSEPKKAASYVFVKKNSDSDYSVQKYDMRDTLLLRGNFKDSLLTVPNGKFLYYAKKTIPQNLLGILHTDTNNYVTSVGYFLNGQKTGMWVKFEKRGVKKCSYIYKNDKLNGQYQRFHRHHIDYVIEEGNYIDDKKEGDWNLYGYDTIKTPVRTRIYNKDKLLKEIVHLKCAAVPADLDRYFKKKLRKLDTLAHEVKAEITIGVNGEIKSPKLISAFSPDARALILEALADMPPFTPQMRDDKPEEMKYTFKFFRMRIFNRPDDKIGFILSKEVGNGMEFNKIRIEL